MAGGGRFRRGLVYRVSGALVGTRDLSHLGGVGLRTLFDDEHGTTLAGVVDGLPAGFGCAAGKDRTGVLAALLQSVAGVDEAGMAQGWGEPPGTWRRTACSPTESRPCGTSSSNPDRPSVRSSDQERPCRP